MRTPHITLFVLVAALAAPATAAAHRGPSTFERAFPAESRLCAALAAGHVPTPLLGSEAQVTEACTALKSAYDAATAAAGGAPTADSAKSAIADARAQVEAACGEDATDPEACAAALRQAHKTLTSAGRGKHRAKRAYRRAIEEARHAFRRAIKPLVQGKWHKHDGEDRPDAAHGDVPTDAPTGDTPHGDEPAEDAPSGDAPTDD